MTYAEAVRFLDSFQNYEQTTAYQYPEAFSLGRVERLTASLDNPHRRYPSLHVAGTKGKGSTCAFAASILSAAGLKTGLYTSPHLISLSERIRVDGTPVSEEDLAAAAERLKPFAGKELTYFEVITACAFLHFEKAGVDAAVFEVGMGGRLDATNILAPEVSGITPVSLDHMAKLGGTIEGIAAEKAGILKRGVPAVISPQSSQAMKVIEQTAAKEGVELHLVEKEVRIEAAETGPDGSRATFETPMGRYENLTIPLLGRHQLMNAAAAIRMVELFFKGEGSLLKAVREGITRTVWPGRCQLISGSPPVLLDGAQNAESARTLVNAVGELFPGRKVALVVGASQEKDLEGMGRVWGPWAARIFITQAPVPRSEPAQKVKEAFAPFHPLPIETGPLEEVLRSAKKEAGPQGVVVVSGSLFVGAEILRGSSPRPEATA